MCHVMCTKHHSPVTRPDLTCKSKNEAPHSRLHHLGTRHYVRQDGTNRGLTRAAMWAGLDEFGRQWTAWIQGASKKDSKHSAKRRRYQAMCITSCFISPRHELSSYQLTAPFLRAPLPWCHDAPVATTIRSALAFNRSFPKICFH